MVSSIAQPASPNEIMKTWPVYRCSTQLGVEYEVQTRDLRCPDLDACLAFLRRILNVQNLGNLSFFEVHRLNVDGTVTIMMGDVNRPWPKGVLHKKVDGVLAPKIPTADDADKAKTAAQEIAKLRQEERERIITTGRNVLEKAIADSRSGNTPPLLPPPSVSTIPDPEDDELGRPVRTHKRGVA